jgi:hypothetical protein
LSSRRFRDVDPVDNYVYYKIYYAHNYIMPDLNYLERLHKKYPENDMKKLKELDKEIKRLYDTQDMIITYAQGSDDSIRHREKDIINMASEFIDAIKKYKNKFNPTLAMGVMLRAKTVLDRRLKIKHEDPTTKEFTQKLKPKYKIPLSDIEEAEKKARQYDELYEDYTPPALPTKKKPISDYEDFMKKVQEEEKKDEDDMNYEKYIKELEKKIPKQKQHTKIIKETKKRNNNIMDNKKKSPWIEFVKQYMIDNNLSYQEALTQAAEPYAEHNQPVNQKAIKIKVDNGNITYPDYMKLFGYKPKETAPESWFKTRDTQEDLHKKISNRFMVMRGLLRSYISKTFKNGEVVKTLKIPTDKDGLKKYDYIVNEFERMRKYMKKYKLPIWGSNEHLSKLPDAKRNAIISELEKSANEGYEEEKNESNQNEKKPPKEKKEKKPPKEKKEKKPPKEKKEKKPPKEKKEKKQKKLSPEFLETQRLVQERQKMRGYEPTPEPDKPQKEKKPKINIDALIKLLNQAYLQKNDQSLGLTRKKIISEKIDKKQNIILHVKNIIVDDDELIDVIKIIPDDDDGDIYEVSLEQMHDIRGAKQLVQYDEFTFES